MRGVQRGFAGLKPRVTSFSGGHGLYSSLHTFRRRPQWRFLTRTCDDSRTWHYSTIIANEEPQVQPRFTSDETLQSNVENLEEETLADDLARPFAQLPDNNSSGREDLSLDDQNGGNTFYADERPMADEDDPEYNYVPVGQSTDYDEEVGRIRYGDMFGLAEQTVLLQESKAQDIYEALRTRDPYTIMRMFIKVSEEDIEALLAIPQTTFREMLRFLDPVHFVGRYLQLHKEISWHHPMYRFQEGNERGQAYAFNAKFISVLMKVFRHFRAEGMQLSIFESKYLLRCATTVGDVPLARTVGRWLERDGIEPDAEWYNQYIAAHVWSDKLSPHFRYQVTPIERPEGLKRGLERTLRPEDVMQHVTSMFDKMMHQGLIGNEETFCLMMIAFGRTGQVAAFESILKRVWNIDADAVMSVDAPDIPLESRIQESSPLRPTHFLLLTLAHTYGINNKIPKALRLIDYVMRQYALDIPLLVWEELVERTFMLHINHVPEESLSLNRLLMLWNTLISEPYDVKPSMYMFDKIIKYHIRNKRKLGDAVLRMNDAAAQHEEDRHRYHELVRLNDAFPTGSKNLHDKMDKDITFLRLRLERNRFYFRNWLRILPKAIAKHNSIEPSWSILYIPRLLGKWTEYMPARIEYATSSGIVTLHRDPDDTMLDSSEKEPSLYTDLSYENDLDDLVDDDSLG